MNTPICDFVRRYAEKNPLRLHMPGHKGEVRLGMEPLDITEIDGADSLYEASGIIAESEKNAGALFGARTFYSAEGSSLCIRAMLYLALLYAKDKGKNPHVLAFPNVHKSFLSATMQLGLDFSLLSGQGETYLSCNLTATDLEKQLDAMEALPCAVYVTSPDYLGGMADIAALAKVCHSRGVLLLVDNAHGAYLKFLPQSLHPMDLGADMCCDSAHKTLPVLTGGAYLHLHPSLDELFFENAKNALSLFGSTSPSYLILQSLDKANPYLEKDFPEALAEFLPLVEKAKTALQRHGYTLFGTEPLKITLSARPFGYTGQELAALLAEKDLVCEFCDPDFLVLMLTPAIGEAGLDRLIRALCGAERKPALARKTFEIRQRAQVLSPREAMLAPAQWLPTEKCAGRILAAPSVGCPPAVPLVLCGQRIEPEDLLHFAYYHIDRLCVVKEK